MYSSTRKNHAIRSSPRLRPTRTRGKPRHIGVPGSALCRIDPPARSAPRTMPYRARCLALFSPRKGAWHRSHRVSTGSCRPPKADRKAGAARTGSSGSGCVRGSVSGSDRGSGSGCVRGSVSGSDRGSVRCRPGSEGKVRPSGCRVRHCAGSTLRRAVRPAQCRTGLPREERWGLLLRPRSRPSTSHRRGRNPPNSPPTRPRRWGDAGPPKADRKAGAVRTGNSGCGRGSVRCRPGSEGKKRPSGCRVRHCAGSTPRRAVRPAQCRTGLPREERWGLLLRPRSRPSTSHRRGRNPPNSPPTRPRRWGDAGPPKADRKAGAVRTGSSGSVRRSVRGGPDHRDEMKHDTRQVSPFDL